MSGFIEAKAFRILTTHPGECVLNRFTILTCSVIFCCSCSDAEQAEPAPSLEKPEASAIESVSSPAVIDPHDLIVPGTLTVDVMGLAVPKRAEEIGRKFKQALAKNPDWFLEHSKNKKPGEPLPHDERMGISKEEYEEFLKLSQKTTMRKMKEAPLIITQKEEDVFELDGGTELSDFTGIVIDLKQDQVQSPFGTLTERSIINAPESTALGAWNGVQWKGNLTEADGVTGSVAKLAMGKIKKSGRCVIYYDVRKITPGEKTHISHILNYDAPQK
ncbi:hypothetical protein GmarT_00450 [Gimesia maris]|uniref:Uncharacterized protein n=1 Tax=Gimesia maris TaxID=122 RepID=A0ABX5YF61_9PLAN|nr:hypothetical protein Mal35_00420 [Gimesia maris]QDU12275.1 hypothetical protein CA11_00520 [Gimesia maris]QEG14212.1 hypothetical protein GmarT_00450 [Gimesia maris]|tara:strand:+ start:34715 stop:35536 length:822 start_codon:yes stop_codon:yes gene_type:complete